MLQQPFTVLCTPIQSPGADGAPLPLHLPDWIFCPPAGDISNGICPPPGAPLRIVPTSAGPRLDFSEAGRPDPHNVGSGREFGRIRSLEASGEAA